MSLGASSSPPLTGWPADNILQAPNRHNHQWNHRWSQKGQLAHQMSSDCIKICPLPCPSLSLIYPPLGLFDWPGDGLQSLYSQAFSVSAKKVSDKRCVSGVSIFIALYLKRFVVIMPAKLRLQLGPAAEIDLTVCGLNRDWMEHSRRRELSIDIIIIIKIITTIINSSSSNNKNISNSKWTFVCGE